MNTITVNASGFVLSGPLVAGEPVAVSVSGLSLAEGAALSLTCTARFPDALLASVALDEGAQGAWTGVLDTATKATALYFLTARADEARTVVLELVDTASRDSLFRVSVPCLNSSLLPKPDQAPGASPIVVPGPPGDPGEAATVSVGEVSTLPAGSAATVTNTGTDQDAVLNFGIPQGQPGAPGEPQTPYTSNPAMDGTASPGSSANYARGDHVHPSDTSKQDALVFNESGVGVAVGTSNGYPFLKVSGTGVGFIGFDGASDSLFTQNGSFSLPAVSGTLATADEIPDEPSEVGISTETWTFAVDDGHGGTTTVTKSVCVVAQS